MKYFSLSVLLLMLVHYSAVAQQPNTLVKYTKSASIPSSISNIDNPAMRAAAIEKLKARNNGEYCVFYNGNVYAFSQADNVKDGEIAIKGSGACYINNKDKSEVSIKSIMDKQFVVKDSHETTKWQITSETQTISNYNCRKAICDETNAEAWFTTDIPIAIGPNGAINLPGLVVKLSIGTSIYTLSGIEECKELTVVLPKGKAIAKEEFNSIRKKRLSELGASDNQGSVQVITL